jgi:hypothetical protein
MSKRASLVRLHEELAELSAQVDAFDVRSVETCNVQARSASIRSCQELGEQCVHLFGAILVVGTGSERAEPPPSSVRSWGSLEQVSLVARMDVEAGCARLEAFHVRGGNRVIEETGSLARKLGRALGAVDRALARATGAACRTSDSERLAASIAVRRAFARFRRTVQVGEEPTSETIFSLMRRLGASIAILSGWPEYGLMRYGDRALLGDLQRKVLGWLEDSSRSANDGIRIWQDFQSVLALTRQINMRPELLAHDEELFALVLQMDRELGADHWERLLDLEGYSDELDALLLLREHPPLAALRETLARVRASRLSTGSSTAA